MAGKSIHDSYSDLYYRQLDSERARLHRELTQGERDQLSDRVWNEVGGNQHQGCSDCRLIEEMGTA